VDYRRALQEMQTQSRAAADESRAGLSVAVGGE